MKLSPVLDKLKKLGLTSYEAQAYLALLKLGDAEADEIASSAKIPMGRIYNVLSNLEDYRLIRAQNTRPRKYVCVEPVAAMDRLLKNRHEELKQAASELEILSSDLASELSGVGRKQHAKSFWTVAIGDESHELAGECISGAKNEVLFFMPSRMTSERIKHRVIKGLYSGILNALSDSLENGVEAKAILSKDIDFSELVEHPAVKKLLLHMGSKFNCRLAEIPATPFDIIDGENVLLKMQNPINPEELFAVVNIRDTKLAGELRKKFFAIWEKAEPFSGNCCDKN